MSVEAFILALISPAIAAAITMLIAGRNGRQSSLLAISLTSFVALGLGFFVGFTVAWSFVSSAATVWIILILFGMAVGMLGYLVTRKTIHG